MFLFSGSVFDKSGSVFDKSGWLFVKSGRLFVKSGRLFVNMGSLVVNLGSLVVNMGRLFVNVGRLFVNMGRLFVNMGKLFVKFIMYLFIYVILFPDFGDKFIKTCNLFYYVSCKFVFICLKLKTSGKLFYHLRFNCSVCWQSLSEKCIAAQD